MMDIFSNLSNFNESVEKPVVGEAGDLIFGGGCCLFAGALGIVSNVIGFIAVITNKKLHTPCFLLISAQLITACLTAFGFLTDGVHFAVSGAKVLDTIHQTRLVCFILGLPKTMTLAPSAVLTFMVGIDRFVSVTWAMHYRKMGRRYAMASLSFCILVTVANTLAAALTGDDPMSAPIPCYNTFLSLDTNFFIYYTCHNLFFCCASVCVYAAIVILVNIRRVANTNLQHSQIQNGSGGQSRPGSGGTISTLQTEDVFLRQQLALLPMIAAMMSLYLITGVVPEVATSLSAFLDQGRYQPRVVVYASVLKAFGTSADVFVLISKSREFRKSLRRMAYKCMRKTVVEPVNDENIIAPVIAIEAK